MFLTRVERLEEDLTKELKYFEPLQLIKKVCYNNARSKETNLDNLPSNGNTNTNIMFVCLLYNYYAKNVNKCKIR